MKITEFLGTVVHGSKGKCDFHFLPVNRVKKFVSASGETKEIGPEETTALQLFGLSVDEAKTVLDLLEKTVFLILRCPVVRVGDTWRDVWAWIGQEIVVTGFVSQSELPWPLVKIRKRTGVVNGGECGLPAFQFGELVKRGKGKSWEKAL